jgi:hypothetical protein
LRDATSETIGMASSRNAADAKRALPGKHSGEKRSV